MTLLEVDNLTMHYKLSEGHVKAVNEVSFKLNQGKTLGLVGESGCGKTSVALSLMGLLPSNGEIIRGKILLNGIDLTKLTDDEIRRMRWKKISMIFQGAMNAFNPVFKVGEQLTEAILAHEDVSEQDAKKRVKALFKLVGLPISRTDNYPHEFSGGMKQRAIIAMSLVCNPNFIIADEPTTALDVVMQDQILNKIKNLQKELKFAMLVISHDISVIAETCNDIAIMYGGMIFEVADAVSIFHNSHNPYTLGLLSSFPNIRGPKKKLFSLKGNPPDLITSKPGCVFESRCPRSENVCKLEKPQLVLVNANKNHYSRCHFANDPKLSESIIEL
jgi:peptide/nickel transport system ATP-binding protein